MKVYICQYHYKEADSCTMGGPLFVPYIVKIADGIVGALKLKFYQ